MFLLKRKHASQPGLNPQPGYEPWPRIEPATFWYRGTQSMCHTGQDPTLSSWQAWAVGVGICGEGLELFAQLTAAVFYTIWLRAPASPLFTHSLSRVCRYFVNLNHSFNSLEQKCKHQKLWFTYGDLQQLQRCLRALLLSRCPLLRLELVRWSEICSIYDHVPLVLLPEFPTDLRDWPVVGGDCALG